MGLAIEIEKGGVPTVAVHTHVFARLAKSVARVNGMPSTRQAFVPQPVVGKSPGELRGYIEGEDPVSGRVFMQELLEGLTAPLTDEDSKGQSFDRSRPRLLDPATRAAAPPGADHGFSLTLFSGVEAPGATPNWASGSSGSPT